MTTREEAREARHSALLRDVVERHVETPDGVRLFYQVLAPPHAPDAPAILLANGLGGRLYAWEPLVEHFAGSHRILIWDYRGLFRSGAPARRKGMGIPFHAQDALTVLEAEGIDAAHFVGWSMGVQVSLEAALERPERVRSLTLLNGTHGHVFENGFQPLMRLPALPRVLHSIVEVVDHTRSVVDLISWFATHPVHTRVVGLLLAAWRRNDRLSDMYRQYVEDVFGDSFYNYLHLFQELDAHSVYHLLPQVRQPALVIAGALDPLTPFALSLAIARRIPGAELLALPFGSHFSLLEYPAKVLPRMERFLQRVEAGEAPVSDRGPRPGPGPGAPAGSPPPASRPRAGGSGPR